MVACIAPDHQPLTAPYHVLPILAMRSGRVLAHEDVSVPSLEIRVVVDRTDDRRVTAVAELVVVARTAVGTFDA